ncbi:hypothetical protein AYO44_07235 [Planctomycetaceae bacterium SCGC AG-212-F19]|nr:hypothetical protein AYO44_07235 [Planctomycetaceae bacterium SCGC AG-212-F19]
MTAYSFSLLRRRAGAFCLFAALCASVTLSGTATAQKGGDAKSTQKSSPKVVAAFHDVVARPSQSTVRIKCDGKDAALGTIVAADGYLLTKFSELKGKITCVLRDGRELEVTVVGVHDKFDVAMLHIDAKDLKTIEWAPSKAAPVGNWVASAGTGENPVAIGVVSVATRNLTSKGAAPAPSPTSGYLGVGLDTDAPGVKIQQVLDGTGAQKAGLKVGDQILAVNGEKMDGAETFMAALQRLKAGDVVTLKIHRDEKDMELKATLGKRPNNTSRGDFQNSLGSELSSRRTGFPTILQHDSVLRPVDCGGPLVDLEGKAIGLNVARAGRTETYAVPSEALLPILADLRNGKLPPPPIAKTDPTPAKLKPEELAKLADAKATVQKLEAERAELERKLAEAKAALEKLQTQLDKK